MAGLSRYTARASGAWRCCNSASGETGNRSAFSVLTHQRCCPRNGKQVLRF